MMLTEYDEIQHEKLLRKTERKEGLKIGRKEGLKIGRKEGLKIGRKEGLKIGRKVAMMRNIQSIMESLHLSFEQAAAALKIPAEEYDFYRNSIIQPPEDALHKSEQ